MIFFWSLTIIRYFQFSMERPFDIFLIIFFSANFFSQIRSSSVLSVIRPVEVRFTFVQHSFYTWHIRSKSVNEFVFFTSNGTVADNLRIQNWNEMDEYRPKQTPTGRSTDTSYVGRLFKFLKGTLNGHATDMEECLMDKNGLLTDINGLKKVIRSGSVRAIR